MPLGSKQLRCATLAEAAVNAGKPVDIATVTNVASGHVRSNVNSSQSFAGWILRGLLTGGNF
jgi:hypothetical protein